MPSPYAFTFPGGNGAELSARLELPPNGDPHAAAIFAHCFTCGKASVAATRISRALAARGIATLRFDFTGLGGSEGDFANSHFAGNVADLVAAAQHLERSLMPPALLVGHSLGGAAIIAAASEIPATKALATIGAPFDTAHVLHLLGDGLETLQDQGEAAVSIAGRSFHVRKDFVDIARSQDQAKRLHDLRRALLVMHAPTDETVGIENAGEIFGAALHPKSFVALDGADHLLTNPADAAFAANIIASWAARYLPAPAAAEADEPVPPGITRVETGQDRDAGRYTQVARSGKHRWIVDEPAKLGGDDKGPGPYEQLLAGLGACTSITMKMYAERKKLPLETVRIDLSHGREHTEDCAGCDETNTPRIDVIDRTIQMTGPLDEKSRARLLEIADKCPVHKTLTNGAKIRTKSA